MRHQPRRPNAAPAQPLAGRSPRTLRRGVQPDAVFVVMRKILGRPRNHGGRLPKPEQKFLQSPGMAAGPRPASPKSKPKAAPENSRTSRNLHHEKPQCPAWAQPLPERSPRTLRRDVHPRRSLCRDTANLGVPAKPRSPIPKTKTKIPETSWDDCGLTTAIAWRQPEDAPARARKSRNLRHEKPQSPTGAQPSAGRSPRTLRRDVPPRRNLCRDAPNLGVPAKP